MTVMQLLFQIAVNRKERQLHQSLQPVALPSIVGPLYTEVRRAASCGAAVCRGKSAPGLLSTTRPHSRGGTTHPPPLQGTRPNFPPGLRPVVNFLCRRISFDQTLSSPPSAPPKTQHHRRRGGGVAGGWTAPSEKEPWSALHKVSSVPQGARAPRDAARGRTVPSPRPHRERCAKGFAGKQCVRVVFEGFLCFYGRNAPRDYCSFRQTVGRFPSRGRRHKVAGGGGRGGGWGADKRGMWWVMGSVARSAVGVDVDVDRSSFPLRPVYWPATRMLANGSPLPTDSRSDGMAGRRGNVAKPSERPLSCCLPARARARKLHAHTRSPTRTSTHVHTRTEERVRAQTHPHRFGSSLLIGRETVQPKSRGAPAASPQCPLSLAQRQAQLRAAATGGPEHVPGRR